MTTLPPHPTASLTDDEIIKRRKALQDFARSFKRSRGSTKLNPFAGKNRAQRASLQRAFISMRSKLNQLRPDNLSF